MQGYGLSIAGLMIICALPLILAPMSGMAKGAAGLSGGPVPQPSDDNRVHRIDRAHMNSVEALASFAVPAAVAMLAGLGAGYLALLVWLFLVIRLVYLAVYIRGGKAAQGGQLRSGIHVAGSLVSLVLIVSTIVAVF